MEYISQKGVEYILDSKRGRWTNINPKNCMTLTAKGQQNWIGSFISPDIDHIERKSKTEPTIIYLKGKGREYIMNNEREELKKLNLRIRKITPRECYRLMGFAKRNEDGTWDDTAFEKAKAVCSDTQLYKQRGNSIITNCLRLIFRSLMGEDV